MEKSNFYQNIDEDRQNHPDATRKEWHNHFRYQIECHHMIETAIKDAWISASANDAVWEIEDEYIGIAVNPVRFRSDPRELDTYAIKFLCRTEKAAASMLKAIQKIFPFVEYDNTTWIYKIQGAFTKKGLDKE